MGRVAQPPRIGSNAIASRRNARRQIEETSLRTSSPSEAQVAVTTERGRAG